MITQEKQTTLYLRSIMATHSHPSSEAAGSKDQVLLSWETTSPYQKKKKKSFCPLCEIIH